CQSALDLSRGDSDGPLHRAHHPRRPRRPEPAAVPLSQQGAARRDRPRPRGGRAALGPDVRVSGVAALDLRAHLLPDRVPQPDHRDVGVGRVVPALPAGRAGYYRPVAPAGHSAVSPSLPALRAHAAELGFVACGVAGLEPSRYGEALDRWLAAGYAGTMRYL